MVGAKGADLPASSDRRRVVFPFQLLLEQQALASITLLEREQDNGALKASGPRLRMRERGPPAREKPTVEAVFDKSRKGALLWNCETFVRVDRTSHHSDGDPEQRPHWDPRDQRLKCGISTYRIS